MLINVIEGQNLNEAVKDNKNAFSRWFTEIRSWEPNLVPRERSIWLKILDVPAHVWHEDFFRKIVLSLGNFITIDQSTKDKVRLDVGHVLVSTRVPSINRVIEVNINGTCFPIRLLE